MADHRENSSEGSDGEGSDLFEVWKEYERIAMHFNELIIQLRVRALAGVAAISALVGFLSRGDPEDFRWGILAAVFFMLVIVWVAIWLLDSRYYDRLLIGSVRAILEIEEASKTQTKIREINISHRIEETVAGNFTGIQKEPFWRSGRLWFYVLVLIALLGGSYFSLNQHCLISPASTLTDKYVCYLTIHWSGPPDKPAAAE